MVRLRRMVPSLLAEAEKVMRTTARLSATLRRLLDARAAAHRVRLATVLRDIRQAALKLRESPPRDLVGLSIDADLEIGSPLARTFWHPPATFDGSAPSEHIVDAEEAMKVASVFANMQRLDFRRLRSVIREGTFAGNTETLGQLLARVPPRNGVVELLGYLQVAHDDGHRIDHELTEVVRLAEPLRRQQPLQVRIPHVTFIPLASSRETANKPR